MSMGEIHISSIQINRIAATSLTKVLDAISSACDHDHKKLTDFHCNQFSGSFVLRQMRGLHSISMHAYGLAIDFDATHNQLSAQPGETFFHSDSIIVRAFRAEGWIWGGDWTSRRDAMHFQAALI